MAEFKVAISLLNEVAKHPNADRLDVARIGGWQIVVGKDQHKKGDLVAYIPEQAVLPQALQKALGVEGKLAGSKQNRVKAIRLRGVLSQGLILPLEKGDLLTHPETKQQKHFEVGADVREFLNITKYEPPIPIQMAGEVSQSPIHLLNYDVENWKSDPEAIPPGTPVLITEKLHGSLCLLVFYGDQVIVTSKGMASKNLYLKPDEKNLYHRATAPHIPKIKQALKDKWPDALATGVVGEIVGRGVQDLHYGHAYPTFYFFEAILKLSEEQPWQYADFAEVKALSQKAEVGCVPLIGETKCPGPQEIERAQKLADGQATIASAHHIREGVVLRTIQEKRDQKGNRMIRKIVSGAYLTRKKGTEHR